MAFPYVIPWALEPNFPAGPNAWNGQPCKVPPVGDIMIPNTKPPAEEFNYILNARDKALNNIMNAVISAGIANWQPRGIFVTVPGPVNGTLGAACWDPGLHQWCALIYNSTNAYAYVTHGGVGDWQNVNATPQAVGDVLAAASGRAAGEAVYAVGNVSAGTDIIITTLVGSVTATTQPFIAGGLSQACLLYVPFAGAYQMIGCTQSGGTFTGYLAGSPDGSGVWTNGTSTLPSTWQTGTNVVGGFVTAINPASNGTTVAVLVGMCAKREGIDLSRLLALDGTGYHDVTPSALSGNRQLTGLAWNAVSQLWGLLCCDSVLGYFYTSPDAATWTLAHTFGIGPSAGCPNTGGLAVVGGVWAAQLTTVAGGLGNIAYNDRVVISQDDGANWTTTGYQMTGDSSTGVFNFPQLISSGTQLMAFNNIEHEFSNQVGFIPSSLLL